MRTMFIVLGAILLLAAAAYFFEDAWEKRRRRREAERYVGRYERSPEDERMAEMDKVSELFTSGAITREEFDRYREELFREQ